MGYFRKKLGSGPSKYIHWEFKLGLLRVSWFRGNKDKFTFRLEISKGWDA